jgi:Na+-transporting methylmalonyl-CoA/oxaloacetate decarboxylase gamma subunit
MLSNLTIGKRIGLGFATVFLFLVIIITLAYSGIAKIVGMLVRSFWATNWTPNSSRRKLIICSGPRPSTAF